MGQGSPEEWEDWCGHTNVRRDVETCDGEIAAN
jgi:hypothetical protein